MNTSLLAVFDSIENFFATIADALQFDILMWVFLGIFALLIIMTLIRLRFTYEVRAIRSFKKINKYFLKKPYINESNLVEFNRLMKKIPYQLRDRWQYYMLNREGLPSSEMTLYHCVEQPIKTSNYKSTIVMLKYITNIATVLCLILSLFVVGGNSVLTPLTLVRGLIIPALFFILCQLYIYFLNAKFNANSVDLYEYYLSFIRNLDKASASIPDYVDYELLFTDKEIRDGIPVLREYLEKRALLDKIAREKAKQNESERENFDFSSLGIDGSLLVERAMTTSQDYLNNRNRLKDEITKLETQKDNYNEQYVNVEKDNQKKLQAIKENLQRLQTQLESSASKIEANYIKKQIDQEKTKQTEIDKNLEDLHVKYAQQIQFLEDEIAKRQAEIEEDKKSVTEQMDAEFETYNEKVYTILRNKIDQDDADDLKVTRAELDETRDKLAAETQAKENLALTLDIRQQQVDTMQSSIDALNDKIAKLTSKDKRNIAKMYDENIELKKRVAELEAQLSPQQDEEAQDEEVTYYDKDGNVVDFSQYYDENGYFKEFPKVYDKDGNYYDFADYYDKYGNPLNAESTAENTVENEENSNVEPTDVATAESTEQPSDEVEQPIDVEQPQEVVQEETTEIPAKEEEPAESSEDAINQQDDDDDDSDGSDIVYYDKDGNVVDFEQYYDENGRFKEFPKVYDKDGNYYDFADYYDRDGNLLDATNVQDEPVEENSESIGETEQHNDIVEPNQENQEEIVEEKPVEQENAEEQPLEVKNNEMVVSVEPEQLQTEAVEEVQPQEEIKVEEPSEPVEEKPEPEITEVAEQETQPVQTTEVLVEEPPKRKRGRPRKVQTEEEAEQPKKTTTKKSPAKKSTTKKGTTTKKTSSTKKSTTKKTTKSGTGAKKTSTSKSTKSTTKKPTTKKTTKKAEEDLDKISGQIDSENAKLEQKQADLKNKITQTLSELQDTPTVDRDLEEIKSIIKKLKDQAAEVNKKDNGLSEEEQKQINKQINKSLSELLLIMANKSKK